MPGSRSWAGWPSAARSRLPRHPPVGNRSPARVDRQPSDARRATRDRRRHRQRPLSTPTGAFATACAGGRALLLDEVAACAVREPRERLAWSRGPRARLLPLRAKPPVWTPAGRYAGGPVPQHEKDTRARSPHQLTHTWAPSGLSATWVSPSPCLGPHVSPGLLAGRRSRLQQLPADARITHRGDLSMHDTRPFEQHVLARPRSEKRYAVPPEPR